MRPGLPGHDREYHGHEADLNALRRKFSISMKGTTLKDRAHAGPAARHDRAGPAAGAGAAEKPRDALHPALGHGSLRRAEGGARHRSSSTIRRSASGANPARVAPPLHRHRARADPHEPGFEKKKDVRKLALSALWGRVKGMGRALVQALVLSLGLAGVRAGVPFYMQLTVDEAVLKGDPSDGRARDRVRPACRC